MLCICTEKETCMKYILKWFKTIDNLEGNELTRSTQGLVKQN